MSNFEYFIITEKYKEGLDIKNKLIGYDDFLILSYDRPELKRNNDIISKRFMHEMTKHYIECYNIITLPCILITWTSPDIKKDYHKKYTYEEYISFNFS